jgi:uncharacterized membrane protein YgdD (TMEM256/DUF423 family)
MQRKILITAVLFGMFAIILGAFGAHALKKTLTSEQLVTFETGVKYQMYHALFLLFVGTTAFVSEKVKFFIFWLTAIGVLFFSGSIYLLATKNVTNINFKFLGILTPFGGLLLIVAWFWLFIDLMRKKS